MEKNMETSMTRYRKCATVMQRIVSHSSSLACIHMR